MCFWYQFAGFLLLIFRSASAALSKLLLPSLIDYFLPQALVSLIWGDVVDARMVVLGVVPSKARIEIGDGLVDIQESTRLLWGSFDSAEGRLSIYRL